MLKTAKFTDFLGSMVSLRIKLGGPELDPIPVFMNPKDRLDSNAHNIITGNGTVVIRYSDNVPEGEIYICEPINIPWDVRKEMKVGEKAWFDGKQYEITVAPSSKDPFARLSVVPLHKEHFAWDDICQCWYDKRDNTPEMEKQNEDFFRRAINDYRRR